MVEWELYEYSENNNLRILPFWTQDQIDQTFLNLRKKPQLIACKKSEGHMLSVLDLLNVEPNWSEYHQDYLTTQNIQLAWNTTGSLSNITSPDL